MRNSGIENSRHRSPYDFTTAPLRKGSGSEKWQKMYDIVPDLPEDIIPFSVADMELKNAPEIAEGVAEYLRDTVMGYTIPTEAYWQSVTDWMSRRHGWEVQKDWLIDYPGVVTALYQIVRLMTEPGDGVILLTPVYYPFYNAVKRNGRTLVECPLKLEGMRYQIDFDLLEELARSPKNKLLLLCNPHNPVGRVWSREELEQLGRIAIDNGVYVASDEIHGDLILPGYQHTVFAQISEEFAQHSFTCTSPSKTFNLAGMLTSNVIVPNPELKKKLRLFRDDQATYFCGMAGYKACEIAYGKCEAWLEELLLLLEENKRLLKEFMEVQFPEVKVFALEGTYLQWMDFRGLGLDYRELERFMQQKAWLFLDEGYVFGKAGEGYERMNIACPKQKLLEALERLERAWKNEKKCGKIKCRA